MTLRPQRDSLESASLVRLAQIEPEVEYLFRHALIQDVAYQSLVKAERKMTIYIESNSRAQAASSSESGGTGGSV